VPYRATLKPLTALLFLLLWVSVFYVLPSPASQGIVVDKDVLFATLLRDDPDEVRNYLWVEIPLRGACSVPQWSAKGNYLAVQVSESDSETLKGSANKIKIIDFSEFNQKVVRLSEKQSNWWQTYTDFKNSFRNGWWESKTYQLPRPASDGLFGAGGWSDYSVEWNPNKEGEFIVVRSSGSGYNLYKVTFSNGQFTEPDPISEQEGWEEYPDWTGDYIAFSLKAGLKVFDAKKKQSIEIKTKPGRTYFYPSWQHKGNELRLAYAATTENDQIWEVFVAKLEKNTLTLSGDEEGLINRKDYGWTYSLPEWSPTKDQVAFYATDNNQTYELRVADISPQNRRVGQLKKISEFKIENVVGKEYSFVGPTWSADGQKLLFFAPKDEYARPKMTCYDVRSSRPRQLKVIEPLDRPRIGKPHQVSCSPTGRLLAFIDMDTRKLWLGITNLKDKTGK
jgi:Tol biopolymer transport system component